MKKFSDSLKLLLYNFRDILIFEIIYNIFLNAVTVPFLRAVINSAIKIAGYQYISNRNLKNFLLCPSTAVILLFVIIFISVCTLFEISAVVYRFSNSINHRKSGIADMFIAGADSCTRAFKKGNISVIAYSLLVLPLTKLSVMSDIAVSVGIPDIISYYARRKQFVLIIYIIINIVLLICFVKWIFSINYYVCEKNSFTVSRKKSNNLTKGRFFKTFFSVALWELSAFMFFSLILFGFSLIVYTLIKTDIISRDYIYLISDFTGIITSCFSFFAVPVIFSFICTDCAIKRNISCEMILYPISYNSSKFNKKSAVVFSLFMCTALLLNIYYIYDTINNGSGIKMEIFNNTEISAHRGDSKHFPENTMPAFASAIDNGADWIELDVQEAMDGTVIVMHDSSFRRTTGIKKNVWELSYLEIRNFNAGKAFSDDYEDAYIPTLEEVINFTKGKIKLNIEIKPSGHEKNLEYSVARLISLYEIEDECIVSSFSANSLKKIKAENPDIKTGYIMSMAMGNLGSIEYADVFSINSVFISKMLVDSVHNSGREIFAWTVNSKSEILKMQKYDVDNIITDNPKYAGNVLDSADSDTLILRMIIYLFGDI